MKVERLFSADSHLPLSLIFASLTLLLFAFRIPGFPQNPDIQALVTVFCGIATLFSLALNRKHWLIAPVIGIALAFVSALYSTTVYSVLPCGSILVTQGYPYPWIQRHSLPPNDRCPAYYDLTNYGLQQAWFYPSTLITFTGFIMDAIFYTLLTLAILELARAARQHVPVPAVGVITGDDRLGKVEKALFIKN